MHEQYWIKKEALNAREYDDIKCTVSSTAEKSARYVLKSICWIDQYRNISWTSGKKKSSNEVGWRGDVLNLGILKNKFIICFISFKNLKSCLSY